MVKNSHLRGYISDEEFKVYQDYSDKFIWYPDLTIFIDTPLKTCINRINTRGRECESTIEKNYLIQLEVEYKKCEFDHILNGLDSVNKVVKQILKICNVD